MTCSPASSTAGSRLPWITLPGMASRQRFSPHRQSTLTTSVGRVAICGYRPQAALRKLLISG
jgi:hypothetical protein